MERDTPSLPPTVRALAEDGDDERRLERIWAELGASQREASDAYDVDASWDQLARRLDLDRKSAPPSSSAETDGRPRSDRGARRPSNSRFSGGARWTRALTAALLIVAVVGLGAWWATRPVTVATAAGEQTTVTLPDGSTVELNGQTSLRYPRSFASLPLVGAAARQVTLDGEAFFSVVESGRPFRVETPNARIEVLGTEFNVWTRADDGTPDTRVTLTSGRVRVAPVAPMEPARDGAVTLSESGQSSRIRGVDGLPSDPMWADLKYVEAWREGGFALSDANLPTVLRELEHRFGTPLELRVPPSETDTMTLHYASGVQLENVLQDICLIQNLSFRETSQGYEIVRE